MGLLDFLKPQAERYPAPETVICDNPIISAHLDFAEGKFVLYKAAPTGSMRPTLQDDDHMVGVKIPYEELKEGDIINYRPKWANGQLVVHRIVMKDKGGWIASGDNNKHHENWERVTKDNYVDKVVKVYRKLNRPKPKLR